MCHERFHRARAWDREAVEETEDDQFVDEPADEWSPSFASGDDPDEDIDVLTDGGDEA